MKKLITICILFISVITHAQKWYGGGSLGLTFGHGYNGIKKVESNFKPLSFFVNIPFGFQSEKEWLYEANITLLGAPVIGASIGKRLKPFVFLVGCNDFISGKFKPLQIVHYFSPQGTLRIMFTKEFYLQGTYTNKTTFISLGLKS